MRCRRSLMRRSPSTVIPILTRRGLWTTFRRTGACARCESCNRLLRVLTFLLWFNFLIETFREYKEALRQQRAQTQDVYRPRFPADGSQQSPTTNENLKLDEELASKYNEPQTNSKKPIQKVIPSRNANFPAPFANGDSNHVPSYVKPSSPVKGSTSLTSAGSPRVVTASLGHTQSSPSSPQGASLSRFRVNSGSPRPMKWNNDIPPDKLSFTMRREFEKAKEEAELIDQLRNVSHQITKMNDFLRAREKLSEVLGKYRVLCKGSIWQDAAILLTYVHGKNVQTGPNPLYRNFDPLPIWKWNHESETFSSRFLS